MRFEGGRWAFPFKLAPVCHIAKRVDILSFCVRGSLLKWKWATCKPLHRFDGWIERRAFEGYKVLIKSSKGKAWKRRDGGNVE